MIMYSYLDLVDKILTKGIRKENRTGIDTLSIFGEEFKHNMSEGFPLLTTKKMYTPGIFAELEGFINGTTDKQWYQERNCKIWNDWCNPQKISYGNDEASKQKMREERDLGPIYGFQWRHFGADYNNYDSDYSNQGTDQLSNLVEKLKSNPNDRRMLISAWNPNDLDKMALPPCHYSFEINTSNNNLNLKWNQRSVDTMLGLPFNISSYGTLLTLLAKEAKLEPGILTGHLGDVHIYENHIDNAKLQLKRKPYKLSTLELPNFTSIFDWTHEDIKLHNYQSYSTIKFPIAV